MSATVRLQPVYSWKGVLKLFSCIAARTASKPKGNRNMLSLFTTTTNSPVRGSPFHLSLIHCTKVSQRLFWPYTESQRSLKHWAPLTFIVCSMYQKTQRHFDKPCFLWASGYIPMLSTVDEGKVVCFERQHSFLCYKMLRTLPSLIFVFFVYVCVCCHSLSLWHARLTSMELSSDILCALFKRLVLGCAFLFTLLVVLLCILGLYMCLELVWSVTH